MTSQPWTTTKLAEQRIADIHRLARTGRPSGLSGHHGDPTRVALATARLLVAAGVRLGGTSALPASLRRRLA
jgi:hypothetical protein